MLTLGSLFDGAGTFPFAAQQCGVKALWASEIEPFPVEVTKRRFPDMKHLGDIRNINGAEIEPVDIITFGSPCQDLSVAGKRAGLDGDRSGLFMEAVRIIKEMRCKTDGEYPKIAIWENVPGAFSSNKGEDFRTVLEELSKIERGNTSIPRPPKRGGRNAWNDAGLILGDEFSIAWRVLDAEFWGVPQRRRRIFLVADFGGQCAGEILFKRKGLSRNFAESRAAWKGITRSLACCSTAKVWDSRGNGDSETCATITGDHENRVTDYTNLLVTGVDCFNQAETGDKSMTICAANGDYNHTPCVVFNILQDPVPNEQVSPCLSTGNPKTGQSSLAVAIYSKGTRPHNSEEAQKWEESFIANCLNVNDLGEARANELIVMATQQGGAEICKDLCPTITAAAGMSGNNQPVICYALDRSSFNQGINAQYDIGIDDSGIAQTLVAKGPGAICVPITLSSKQQSLVMSKNLANTLRANDYKEPQVVGFLAKENYIIRRLTPTECGRLQGMPDWWCEDVPHSDSAEYKMWGNGMALPNVLYVMENVVSALSVRALNSLLEVSE